MFFGGRYIILLMGLFSIYTGIVYNDIFSKSVNVFGSSWHNCFEVEAIEHHEAESMMLPPENVTCYYGSPYPFGFDPAWQVCGPCPVGFLVAAEIAYELYTKFPNGL